MKKVLIVDDEEKLRSLLSRIITLEGFEVVQVGTCKKAQEQLSTQPFDIVLCDVKLPDGNGVDFVTTIKSKQPHAEVILLTAFGNIPDGVQAVKNGAFDYITKGDDNNKIIPLLYRAVEKVDLTNRIKQLEKQLNNTVSFEAIIGQSPLIKQAINLAQKVAATNTTVLLTGETGTGKEVFAQAIHQGSQRANYNFVALNCSAISKDLLESEMFGHKAGAFTGAQKDQHGLFYEANNGTIFLDEIGEMDIALQAKLLRVLESGEYFRVGDTKPTKVNVRVISATNRDLKAEIKAGNFREDLFYRLSVFQIQLPPLRKRTEDIELLTQYFIGTFAAKTQKRISTISNTALALLKNYTWSGNIRELKNVIERALILCNGDEISEEDLPLDIINQHTNNQTPTHFTEYELAGAEKLHIEKVLAHTNGNKTETARLLNIALTTLYRKLAEYKIN